MRRMLLLVGLALFLLPVAAGASSTPSIPSGERALGQSVIEPVYNDEQAGTIGYVSTPTHLPDPVKGTPALKPFFLPVYPVGSSVGPLICQHTPAENCPTHGNVIAGLAQSLEPSVYGAGVLGHDHLMDFPGGSNFNANWLPIVVLFTSTKAADEHLLTDDQIEAAVDRGDAIELPLPPAAFLCAPVPAATYDRATPLR
jgi:hypothetical protein